MAQLAVYLTIIILIIMHVHVNESKPILIPAAFLERLWSTELDFPYQQRIVCKINLFQTRDKIKILFLGTIECSISC
jgi:hypothetical protein